MNGPPKATKELAVDNVEFVRNDEGNQRSKKKKKKKRSQGSSEAHVLLGTPPGRDMPLFDEEQGETNPLLGKSSTGSYGIGMTQQYQSYRGPEQQAMYRYEYGYQGQGHQHPPSPPQVYPPAMMNMPPNAIYQYYDQMSAPVYHPIQGQQQQMQHSPYKSPSNHRRTRSPHGQPQGRRATASSPPPQQIRQAYPDSPDGAEHPLKRSPMSEYETPIKASPSQKHGAATAEKTTPPRSSQSKAPTRRKSDISPLPQRPPSPLTRSHRRVSSDGKFGRHRRINSEKLRLSESEPANGKHRRSSSDKLPPKGLGRVRRSLNPYPANRGRSYSGGAPSSSSGNLPRPSHARASSFSEVSIGASVATSTSMVSHVTDISKSAFFGGTTETGKVQLHFPFENVRLTMDDALPTGHLYMRHVDEEAYEDYHIINDDHIVPWELDGALCTCTCAKCSGCTERSQQLAPNHYIMTVEDDLYRRIFDEIAASRSMPCDLFFCGHHEDVSYPSIMIAGTIVFVFLALLVVATIMTNA